MTRALWDEVGVAGAKRLSLPIDRQFRAPTQNVTDGFIRAGGFRFCLTGFFVSPQTECDGGSGDQRVFDILCHTIVIPKPTTRAHPTFSRTQKSMQSLDLTLAPPRSPRAELNGIVFLPRSIDKARAALPGGNLGEYTIEGFTTMMLEMFGIADGDFIARVQAATTDDEIAAFVLARASAEQIAAWNVLVSQRLPRNGDRAAALEHYLWLGKRPDLILALDVLEEDDRQIFAR